MITIARNFQSDAGRQGRAWEMHVESWLKFRDWTITGRRVTLDNVEIDLVASDPTGLEWWIEAKGSHLGRRPGLRRCDTVKKAVAVAYHLRAGGHSTPYAVVASDMPIPGSAGDAMLARAIACGAVTWAGITGGVAPTIST